MNGMAGRTQRPELKALVAEASRALALLDAPRLEELAACCAALNRDLPPRGAGEPKRLAREAAEAVGEMRVFAHVLDATRANLRVMQRLRDLRMGLLEYNERAGAADGYRRENEYGHGDD